MKTICPVLLSDVVLPWDLLLREKVERILGRDEVEEEVDRMFAIDEFYLEEEK